MTRIGITIYREDITRDESRNIVSVQSSTVFLYGNGLVQLQDSYFIQELRRTTFPSISAFEVYCRSVGFHEPRGRCNPEVLDEYIVAIGDESAVWIGSSQED